MSNDFSENIDGLVIKLMEASGEGGKVYVGRLHDFYLVINNSALWLTKYKFTLGEAEQVVGHLSKLRGRYLAPRLIRKTDVPLSGGRSSESAYISAYIIDLTMIPQKEETLKGDLNELARLLKDYKRLPQYRTMFL